MVVRRAVAVEDNPIRRPVGGIGDTRDLGRGECVEDGTARARARQGTGQGQATHDMAAAHRRPTITDEQDLHGFGGLQPRRLASVRGTALAATLLPMALAGLVVGFMHNSLASYGRAGTESS